MSTVNIGVVGLGFMGTTHLKSYQKIPDARIAALCVPRPIAAGGVFAGVAGNVGDGKPLQLDLTRVKAYAKFEDMLNDPAIDLVDLCVPTPLHLPMTITALEAGKHVLCEKPMARTSTQCRQIVEAAAKAKGFFMPAMVMRFWPEWAFVKKNMQTFGRPLAARFRRVSSPPHWSRHRYFKGEESGGALLDFHIHDTDFVQFCFGRPKGVFSTGISRYSGAIDHVNTIYEVEAGIPVTAEASWLMNPGFGFSMAYTINFDQATVDYDSARGAESLKLYLEGDAPRVIPVAAEDGYEMELRHIIESIQKGAPPGIVTAADGLSAVEICEAEEKSTQTRQFVKLSQKGQS